MAGRGAAVRFEQDTRTLHLRPCSDACRTQLTLHQRPCWGWRAGRPGDADPPLIRAPYPHLPGSNTGYPGSHLAREDHPLPC
ncbi:hypothetical protein SSCG_03561 [Streptomyces clavuligerus]|nr:hypothetical protein SSCG_03561 [Streptomyces clavuligerus]